MPGQLDGYSAFETVALSRTEDGILLVRLCNPDGGPLEFSMTAHAEWVRLWTEIRDDDKTRVAIITGTGETFIGQRTAPVGGEGRSNPITPQYWQRIMRESTDHLNKMLEIPVPVIAAVNGPVPVHAPVALLCDLVLATPDVTFRDAEHLPAQVLPTDAQHFLMPEIIGRLRSNWYFLTDQRISAEEAWRLGMINEIVPRELMLARALQIARFISRQPDVNLRYYKRLITHELRVKMQSLVEYGLAMEGLAALSVDWSGWETQPDGLPSLERANLSPLAPEDFARSRP